MALKKSELYSSLWSSCDELRGGMDASQYKDYVLSLLFIKYISDKYDGKPFSPIKIPEGASFQAMVALKGKPDVGDQINKRVIAPLAAANQQLSQSDFPDFNDPVKLGDGKEKVERLTNLIAIFEGKSLDFSKNRADGDDILGDAYEYLMRHFATESGKSKGQFYTPAEVSRIMAQILGIRAAKTTSDTTVYDPTCGSGSLLLKVGDEAGTAVTVYGQEKDATTSGLARMNMILHNNPTATIAQGNALASPKFLDGDLLKTFDYVVANPPFSDKRWSTGIDPPGDPYERFKPFGVPPAKQGDYAYLLHIVRSLKSTGTGACIMPHGVLFRGHAEADIRRNLVKKGYVKGIIGLPPNLFYGTGIPACIVVIDKKDAAGRRAIFMIDASDGFMKDGPKNRLRSQDIHKIVDVFNRQEEVPGYSKLVSMEEIEKNEFNLNLPRYIDSRAAEDIQDIAGHLYGGIPVADVDALARYWEVCPGLRDALFAENRPGYVDLAVDKAQIKQTIYEHPEFAAFIERMNEHFAKWRGKAAKRLKGLAAGCQPKQVIAELSEDLLAHYSGCPLINHYDVYQHLMDYWAEVMQDDVYQIAAEDWKAETYRILVKDKKGKEKDKGWACDLVPKSLIVRRYYADRQAAINELQAELESVSAQRTELEEEHSGDEGLLADLEKINKQTVTARLKELEQDQLLDARPRLRSQKAAETVQDQPQGASPRFGDNTKGQPDASELRLKVAETPASYEVGTSDVDEINVLKKWLKNSAKEAKLKKQIKDAEAGLDAAAYAKCPELSEDEVKSLVVDDKWIARLDADVHGEMDRISQSLTQRVNELAERYASPLPHLSDQVAEMEEKVDDHLKRMGYGVTEATLAEVGA